jgi:transposase
MAESSARIRIRDEDMAVLVSWARAPSIPAGAALRARIVLASAQGQGTSQVAARLAVSRPTVIAWRERYRAGGIAALADARARGGPRRSIRPRSWPAPWSPRPLTWG